MERYHIFKLGLAILFYATHCIRPLFCNGESSNNNGTSSDFLVYYQGVEGRPGIDFPVHSYIPRTTFNCKDVETGYYADLDTDCQVFHICEEGKKISFLCPNGTIFQQSDLICEWWFKVNCTNSPNLYEESAEQLREDNARRKASRRVNLNNNHGAIMRTEEQVSVTAHKNGQKVHLNHHNVIHDHKDDRKNSLHTSSSNYQRRNFNSVVTTTTFQPNLDEVIFTTNSPSEDASLGKRFKEQFTRGPEFDQTVGKRFEKHFRNSIRDQIKAETTTEPDVALGGVRYTSKLLEEYTRANQLTTPPGFPLHESEKKQSRIVDSDETQVLQETGSFYKNSFNSVKDESKSTVHPNHRSTYSDLKKPTFSAISTGSSKISSVTPQYLTTQSINNGKPFIGSRVGGFSSTKPNKTELSSTTPRQVQDPRKSTIILGVLRHQGPTVKPRSKSLKYDDQIVNKGSTITGYSSVTNNPRTVTSTLKPSTVYVTGIPAAKPQKISLKVSSNLGPKKDPEIITGRPGSLQQDFVHISGVSASLNKKHPSTTTARSTTTITTTERTTISHETLTPSGFYVTKNIVESSTAKPSFALEQSSSNYFTPKTDRVKPRPFQAPVPKGRALAPPKNNFVNPTIPPYKISSAQPFMLRKNDDYAPTLPTPTEELPPKEMAVYENVDNMIGVLKEIAKVKGDFSKETPRPGLVIPPSAGPQTLHTLAVYFANALDGVVNDSEKRSRLMERNKDELTSLLTQMTQHHYMELFRQQQKRKEKELKVDITTTMQPTEDMLQTDHSTNLVQTPHIRNLAKNFSVALSSYLDNPEMFRKDLQRLRPTEPPPLSNTEDPNEEELLNFSDADAKSSYPPIYPTAPSAVPTWGYILSFNNKTKPETDLDVKNSLNPDLQGADSQSFVPQFNNVAVKEKTPRKLPVNHWTTSPGATKLWRNTFSVNPVSFNQNFDQTEPISSEESTEAPKYREIQYELRAIPNIKLNSTQVHGILIDFMNKTKEEDTSKLLRILRKLNTTEEEFLHKMKEIENNPLTRRLILLLISECGANITHSIPKTTEAPVKRARELLHSADSSSFVTKAPPQVQPSTTSVINQLIDPSLKEDDHDTRALQLLNSLYSIASKFG